MSEYKLIDCGDFKRYEDWGGFCIVRPAPAAVWQPVESSSKWKNVDAEFLRFENGKGRWEIHNKNLPKQWQVEHGGIQFNVQLTSFGHLGIFPEHALHWSDLHELMAQGPEQAKVLNLFAYTGGASLACAKAGAEVTHVDASKVSIEWGKSNADLNALGSSPIRWLVDDALAFVKREGRRGNKYHGVILDPPSYGRGPKKQLWKIEDHMNELMEAIKDILAEDYLFVLVTSHSAGYTPLALENLLHSLFKPKNIKSGEMAVQADSGLKMPSGSFALASESR